MESFQENQTQLTMFDDGGNTLFDQEVIEFDLAPEVFVEEKTYLPYLSEGSTFVRKYTIKKFLGQGAMGIAYLAEEEGSYNQVVIKEFFPKGMVKRESDSTVALDDNATIHQVNSYNNMKKVFEEEAQNIVTINSVPHKNVAGFISLERDINNTIYYLMPYSEGEEFGDYLTRLRKEEHLFSQKEIMALIEPILNGLIHIHNYGIYHKDIKPANIFIRKDDEPLLIDFGASVTSAHLMTPSYAPIEQVKRVVSEYGAYTDLYAVGVIMYEIIVGTKPTKSKLRAEAIARGERDPYQPLSKKKELNRRFENFFLGAIDHVLSLSYRDRPQNATLFKEELKGDIKRKKRNRVLVSIFFIATVLSILGYEIYEKKRVKNAYLIVPHGEQAQLMVDNRLVKAEKDGRYKISLGEHSIEIKNSLGYLSVVKEIKFKKEKSQQRVDNPLIKEAVVLSIRTKENFVAEVEINKKFVGNTPYVGKLYFDKKGGGIEKNYSIVLSKEGYSNSKTKRIIYKELMKKENNLINIALRKEEGCVKVTTPVGFKVKVNGKLIKDKNGRAEITPLKFKRPPGVYTVLLYSSKREKQLKVYNHIVKKITVKDQDTTQFPKLKAVKSKRYLQAKKRESKRALKSKAFKKKHAILIHAKAPILGREFNGVQFAKKEVTYDEVVRFLNSANLSSELLNRYFMVRSNIISKHIKKEIVQGEVEYYVYKGYENYPFIQISWYGAKHYIRWLNRKVGGNYRLATKSEWEMVARLEPTPLTDKTLNPVGTKKANSLGLYDIFGNVAEWGEDDFGEFSKVTLGGSYKTFSDYFSPTMRGGMNAHSNRNIDIGFRLVK
jgi:serine/threonine protein kinase